MNRTDAEKFIAVLTGSINTSLTFQAWGEGATKGQSRAPMIGTLAERWDELEKLNTRGMAIGVMINEGDNQGRKAENVLRIRALWVDHDDEDLTPPNFLIEPNILVSSSLSPSKWHAYWLADVPLESFSEAQLRLAQYYNGDRAVSDVARVMRLPGSLNWKREGEPQPVKLWRAIPSQAHTLPELSEGLPSVDVRKREDLRDDERPREIANDLAQKNAAEIERLLRAQGRAYTIRDVATLQLQQCILFPEHLDAQIACYNDGQIVARCFHDHCNGNRNIWYRVAPKIGWRSVGFTGDSEVEIGKRLVDDMTTPESPARGYLQDLLCYRPERGDWRAFPETELAKRVHEYDGAPIGEKGRRLALSSRKIKGILKCAVEGATERNTFENAPPGIACTNGFLTRVGDDTKLVPNAPENFQTTSLPYEYDPNATCPIFQRTLEQVLGESDKIDYLQEFIGACLFGIATKFARSTVLLGNGANGKSTIINAIAELFPTETRTTLSPHDLERGFESVMLKYSRFNYTAEMPENQLMGSSRFKAIISGDPITVSYKHKDSFTLHPRAGHLFAANAMPANNDHTLGYERRFVILTCDREFTATADVNLAEKLLSELPGILAWAVRGAARLFKQNRYTIPASNEAAMRGWREETDSVAAYAALCKCNVGYWVSATKLHAAYVAWCDRVKHRAVTPTKFGARLHSLGVNKKRKEDGIYYEIEPFILDFDTYLN